jgi:hypothetical protein
MIAAAIKKAIHTGLQSAIPEFAPKIRKARQIRFLESDGRVTLLGLKLSAETACK